MQIVKLGPLLVMLLIVAPATADTQAFPDPEDTAGRLDIVSLRHGHSDNGLWHSLTMQRGRHGRALR